jgi:hypothetical protein
MKKYIRLTLVLILFISCKKFGHEHVKEQVWKFSGGKYEINDFISFDEDLKLNDHMEVFLKDSCLGKVISVSKEEIVIQSTLTNETGTYTVLKPITR